jgi:hypothetical protein
MKNVIYILITLLCIQCNQSTPNKKEVKDKDTVIIASNIDLTAKTSTESEITCPKCSHKKTEKLPTEVCLVSYTCENCKEVLHPKDGDCCVFCTYGSHKCPSKQEKIN